MTSAATPNHENYQALSSPLMGEDNGGGGPGMFPLTTLSRQETVSQ
jgi:hypothetical protein